MMYKFWEEIGGKIKKEEVQLKPLAKGPGREI